MAHHYRKKIAYVNGALIIINVLYFFYLEWKGSTQDAEFMITYGAMFTPLITEQGEYYRLLTSVFMHFGLSHLANNMVIQFVLGDNLERALGPLKYLLLYLVSGIGANIFSMIISINDYELSVSAGASGAIFGVIGGLLYVVVKIRGQLEDLSARQLILFVACSLYFGFTSIGVDNAAHVGGLVLGVILAFLFYQSPERPEPDGEERRHE